MFLQVLFLRLGRVNISSCEKNCSIKIVPEIEMFKIPGSSA